MLAASFALSGLTAFPLLPSSAISDAEVGMSVLAALAGVTGVLWLVARKLKPVEEDARPHVWPDVIAGALVATGSWYIPRYWTHAEASPGLSVLAVLLVGVSAYRIRTARRGMYGSLEIFVGVVLALQALLPRDVDDPSLKALGSYLTAVYVIVRGLDNVHQGLRRASKERATWESLFRY